MSQAKERIFEAARAAFSEKGFDGVSVDEIAHRAGVKKALIYYYFPSKEHLFEKVWSSALEELEQHIFNEIEGENIYISKIKRFLKAYVDFVTSRRVVSRVIERERAAVLDGVFEKNETWSKLRERYDDFVTKVAKLIEEGKTDQVISSDIDPKAAAKLIADTMTNIPQSPSIAKSLQLLILRGLTNQQN
ncbi:MAG: TetR/AcrR family transcriptional regulator [Thermotogae bacterium]|nr:MAG: TetR/AcrR family transcriptional regulator [Thermotogota bacterium]